MSDNYYYLFNNPNPSKESSYYTSERPGDSGHSTVWVSDLIGCPSTEGVERHQQLEQTGGAPGPRPNGSIFSLASGDYEFQYVLFINCCVAHLYEHCIPNPATIFPSQWLRVRTISHLFKLHWAAPFKLDAPLWLRLNPLRLSESALNHLATAQTHRCTPLPPKSLA
jgi:hypothetical protein